MESYIPFYQSASITATSGDASATVVYTVPSKFEAELSVLLLSSGDTGSTDTNIQIKRGSTYSYVLKKYSLAANSFINPIENGTLYLNAGDSVVSHRNANALDVTVSGKLIFKESS